MLSWQNILRNSGKICKTVAIREWMSDVRSRRRSCMVHWCVHCTFSLGCRPVMQRLRPLKCQVATSMSKEQQFIKHLKFRSNDIFTITWISITAKQDIVQCVHWTSSSHARAVTSEMSSQQQYDIKFNTLLSHNIYV